MNSLILCEGKTDCILLQYYLEKVHSWKRVGKSPFHAVEGAWSNLFTKDSNFLIISETKGCSRITEGLGTAIERNRYAGPGKKDEFLDKIIIFTDNDEEETQENMISEISDRLKATGVSAIVKGNGWNKCELEAFGEERTFELYVMFIPFDENGALETYLLNCIGSKDDYDKEIINQGNRFIDNIDPEEKYLRQRRLRTKAKFDVYFSVRTAADQYAERQNILRSVAWEEYDSMRQDFKIFSELG